MNATTLRAPMALAVGAILVSCASDASVPGEFQLELVGTYELAIAADLAASPDKQLVAISEWFVGAVSLVDVSDPENPGLYARIDNVGDNADVQIKGDWLYVNHEPDSAGGTPVGVTMYDISDPANPALRVSISPTNGHQGLQSCHNTWVQPDRELLFCASPLSGHVVIVSTGDAGVGSPELPEVVAAVSSPGGFCRIPHDMYAIGDRLYVAWLCDGLAIYDISDASLPVQIGAHNYQDSMTHSVWPTADGNYLLSSDEQFGGHMRIWDIRDLGNISQVGSYQPVPTASMHNVEVAGDVAFISHYTAGVHAVDIGDPTAPTAIDSDDFVPGPDDIDGPGGIFRGAWGVEPAAPYVYVSEIEGGLRIYRMMPTVDAPASQ